MVVRCAALNIEFLKKTRVSLITRYKHVLFVFLRFIVGCHQSVHRYTLLLEFGFTPYQVQYARLCARYWNNAREGTSLSGKHLKANLLFFQCGNR
jgi:hypothetical protein